MKTVIWSPGAKAALDQTLLFIETEFGVKARIRFKNEVRRVNNLLKTNPELGPVEPLLSDLPVIYHSVVVNSIHSVLINRRAEFSRSACFY